MKRRVAVLISGRGSNMAALIQAGCGPEYPAEIVLVVSSRPDAPGLALARDLGVPATCIDAKKFGADRLGHEQAISEALQEVRAEFVCLAGWMRLFTPWFVGLYAGRTLNIHPSLLPAFPGVHTHERALAAGVKLHGCTVHLVTEAMDAGPILAQAAVPVLPRDTAGILAARVLVQEHAIYPAALAAVASGVEQHPAETGSTLHNPQSTRT